MAIKIKTPSVVKLLPRPEMDPVMRNRQRLSRAHKRLLTLGPERVRDLEQRLLEGQSLTKVAGVIQKEWHEFEGVKELTLMKELERFRAARVDGRLLFMRDTDYGKQVFGKYSEGIDVLVQMEEVVHVQQERVSKLYQTEKSLSKVLMEQMRRELLLLTGMYSQLMEMQMEMGVLKRAPKEFSVEIAASKAQEAVENAMRTNENVDRALRKAYGIIEGEFSQVGPH